MVHPEMVLVTAKALVLAVPDPTAEQGERIAFCSYLHVTHVETLRPQTERRASRSRPPKREEIPI